MLVRQIADSKLAQFAYLMMGDSAHAADMQVFHQLFDHRTEIKRQVLLPGWHRDCH